MFRTSNPALRKSEFAPAQTWDDLDRQGRGISTADRGASAPARAAEPGVMTVQGTVNKTFLLLGLCVTTAVLGWSMSTSENPLFGLPSVSPFLLAMIGFIGGLVLVLVASFNPKISPVVAPMYAIVKGFAVGGISAAFASWAAPKAGVAVSASATSLNTGLVLNAAVLTFAIAAGVLASYATGLVRPGKTFYNIVIAGTIGAALFGLVAMVTAMFGNNTLASVYDPNNGGLVSVGFSLLLVVLASANLVLDFDIVANGARNRAPKYMEWYGGLSILVTMVWLYIEVLRLLAKLRSGE